MHRSENCYVIEYTQYRAQEVVLNKQCSDLSLNVCNVFFTSLKWIMTGKATVPQAEKTGYDSACIKIFGGNISYVCHFTVAKLQKRIVDMCVYITCLAQPSCFLKLIFHMNSMQMQIFIAGSIKCFIWNKEELPEEWKGSIIVPIHKKGDKTIVITIGANRFCQLRTKLCPTFCSQG